MIETPNPSQHTSVKEESVRQYPYWKIGLLTIILLLGFTALLARLFLVQVIRSDTYKKLARKQYEFIVEMKPERGIIYDRSMNPLAITIRSTSYAADPKMVKNNEALIRTLCAVSGDSLEYWKAKLNQQKSSFVWLLRNGYYDTKALDTLKDPGVIRIKEPRRTYLFGEAGSQVIGCTNVDNKGLSGIELAFDSILRGTKGQKILLRDGRGNIRPMVDFPTLPAVNGSSIVTTLDIELQRIAEYELQHGIEESGASSGTVVAVDPTTGEILALASLPSFNPNFPSSAATESMRLRAITDMYEPGSTFKLVTAAAALEEGIVNPTDTVSGEGGAWRYGDVEIKDSHPIGKVTFTQAMEQSSNVVFARLAQKLPDDVFYKYARDFGFGIETGIDIPGEVRGRLKKPRMFDGSTKLFMSYGYQLAVTAMQTLNSYAAIANKGIMMRPFLVRSILNDKGEEVVHNAPQKIRQIVSEQTAQTLSEILTKVVDYGTAQQAKIPGLPIAGKTGTAQQLVNGEYTREAYTASFVGFFPAQSPKLAMIVMLDKPMTNIYGGMTAAPIFRRIASRWVSAKRITVVNNEKQNIVNADSVTMPDIRGMSYTVAKETIERIGLRCTKTKEEGTVIAQIPPPGITVPTSLTVMLTVRSGKYNHKDTTATVTKPDVRGMSIRRALAVLHAAGCLVKVRGSGYVKEQLWQINNSGKSCILICTPVL